MRLSDYIKKWAEEDFEVGQTFSRDDFNEFKKILTDDVPELKGQSEELFKKCFEAYFEYLEECRAE